MLWFVAGCSGAPRDASRSPAVTTAEAIFSDKCQTCHAEQVEGRPQFATTKLTPIAANQALRAVVAGQMPPGGEEKLSYAERDSLSAWLCEGTRRTSDECRGILHVGRPARPADAFLSTVKIPFRAAPDMGSFDYALREHVRPASTGAWLDPTYMLFVSLLALETCESEQDIGACHARFLDAAEATPPPPAKPRKAP
jgi:hypothetical protein